MYIYLHTHKDTHANTRAHTTYELALCAVAHCAGSAGEACAELRHVNDAQAARIAQLEAELRACKRGVPWLLLAPRDVRCMLDCPRRSSAWRVARSMLHAVHTA